MEIRSRRFHPMNQPVVRALTTRRRISGEATATEHATTRSVDWLGQPAS
jgi:hypothetical protein